MLQLAITIDHTVQCDKPEWYGIGIHEFGFGFMNETRLYRRLLVATIIIHSATVATSSCMGSLVASALLVLYMPSWVLVFYRRNYGGIMRCCVC